LVYDIRHILLPWCLVNLHNKNASVMKTTTLDTRHFAGRQVSHNKLRVFVQIKGWIKEQEPGWEYNRLGISASGIFIQVTFAGAMMGVLAVAGASPFVYSVGVLFAFMANSFAFAQFPMRWVLGVMTAGIVIDILLMLFYGIRLLA
jgi:hypothetical protein